MVHQYVEHMPLKKMKHNVSQMLKLVLVFNYGQIDKECQIYNYTISTC